ncbi:sigma-E factor negative regulatory protein [Actinobacillus pleuropneumoniae]|nr:sigma-E factor negative regulatory protein [Actinobacillus pleuropneumoniae]
MQQNETLSAFMDGKKVDDAFIDELCESPELKQKWARYHAVSSVCTVMRLFLVVIFQQKWKRYWKMKKSNLSRPFRKLRLLLRVN